MTGFDNWLLVLSSEVLNESCSVGHLLRCDFTLGAQIALVAQKQANNPGSRILLDLLSFETLKCTEAGLVRRMVGSPASYGKRRP
eukprot:245603-Amphidinium_carterae.2